MKSATVRIEGDSNTFYYQNLNVSSSFLGTNVAVTNMKSVGELNLVGNASETEYEVALNSVIYVNTAEDIGRLPFDHVVIVFSMYDGKSLLEQRKQ
jgi:hypothetical protein